MARALTTTDAAQPARGSLTAQLAPGVRRFLRTESGSAVLLVAAAVVAMAWANVAPGSYESLWHVRAGVRIGDWSLAMDLRHWLDEGAMALFFLVVGLEVRREWSMGELVDRRRASLPVLGGIGGMVVPVAVFLVLVGGAGARGADGWGIVLATDTAFLLGALALVGPRVSTQLRIFLLTLSIVDDLVAIAVIGVVYSGTVELVPVVVAGVLLAVLALLGRIGVTVLAPQLVLVAGVWLATHEAGLHATIAGMCAGLVIGAWEPRRADVERAAGLARLYRQSPLPEVAHAARVNVDRSISPNERLLHRLHPWTAYAIVPLFALANAGIAMGDGVLADAVTSRLAWAVLVALVVGKLVGITAGTLGPRRLGLGALPVGVGAGHVVGGAALSGIGFTVSLLIAGLAFDDPRLEAEAKLAILAAVVVSVAAGKVAFVLARRLRGEGDATLPRELAVPVDAAVDHVRGRADAPMVLVEYGDFECDFCSRATGMIDELRDELGADLAYVFRHLPLDDVHSDAIAASQAVEAAGAQGRFWEMHDLLFAHYDALDDASLVGYARQLGLDVERFERDLDDVRVLRRIRRDVAGAEASGARGTPTFFVNGVRHEGAYDTRTLVRELREAAAESSAEG